MIQAYGLYGHIRNNRIRSAVLLAGFVVLLQALIYSFLIISNAFFGGHRFLDEILLGAWQSYKVLWPGGMAVAAVWFAIAWAGHQSMIARATGAVDVVRQREPKLYNALENLCISRGIPMPALQIIETPALNAYAAGLKEGDYVVAVTRGLVETLSDKELETVLAHELTHIRNKDAQLMVVAIIFAGMFGFLGDLAVRRWDFPYGASPRHRRDTSGDDSGWGTTSSGSSSSGGSSRRERDGGSGGGGAVVIAIIIAIVIMLITWGISTLIRFALSRSREYLADAGAVELTKDPDAMIAALRKIEKNAVYEVPSRMEAFFIESPVKSRITGFFDTHPAMADRIAALTKFAGGRASPTP
jgi:heat shock protein HtpX